MFKLTCLPLLFIICLLGFSCSKTQEKKELPNLLPNSKLGISQVTQTDLNVFQISYSVDLSKSGSLNSYGLIIEPADDANAGKKVLILGKDAAANVSDKTIIDGLKGNTTYSVKLFVNNGKDSAFSMEEIIKTGSLKIDYPTGSASYSYCSPSELNAIRINSKGNSKPEVRVWIDTTECKVTGRQENTIFFKIPETIASGSRRIKISSLGLETNDFCYIYFGKWFSLGAYEVQVNPNTNADNNIQSFSAVPFKGKGYLVGGAYSQWYLGASGETVSFNEIREYNPATNEWKFIAPKHAMKFTTPLVQPVGDRFLVISGAYDDPDLPPQLFKPRSPLANVLEYDFSNNDWIKRDSIPEGVRSQTYAFQYNGSIYFGTGTSGKDIFTSDGYYTQYFRNQFWKYNTANGQWTRLRDFPGRSRTQAGSFVIGNKAYMAGGWLESNYDSYLFTNEIWEYDIPNDSWRLIRSPGPGAGPYPFTSSTCFSYNGKGYIFDCWERFAGGVGYGYTRVKNWEFDPATEKLREVVSPLYDVSGGMLYSNNNEFIFAGKGVNGVGDTYTKTVTKLVLK
ncbi:MAG: hypothetical protein J7539_07480 [Niabella sp.]|nr:hypothetical protein [Niabella sp.]